MKRSIIMLLTLATLSACADKIKIRDQKMRAQAIAFISENLRYNNSKLKFDSLQMGRVDSLTEKASLQLLSHCIEALIDSEKNGIADEYRSIQSEEETRRILLHNSTDTYRVESRSRKIEQFEKDMIRRKELHIQFYQQRMDSVQNRMAHADTVKPYALYARITSYVSDSQGHYSRSGFFVVPYREEPQMFLDQLH